MNVHQRFRPEKRIGVGPITVYRAVAPVQQPDLQMPQGWVVSQNAYRGIVSQAGHASAAAALMAASVPGVPKVWTELAFEEVREEIAASYPSRLASLFACVDPIEAFAFTEASGQAQQVFEAEVAEDVPWCVVDMDHFQVVEPPSSDAKGFEEARTQARSYAQQYWQPGEKIGTAEILVGGAMVLKRRLALIPVLSALGLVE